MLVEREEACFQNSGVALYFEQNQTPNRRLKHANVPRGAEQYTPPQKLQGEPQTSGPHRNRDECLTRTRPGPTTTTHGGSSSLQGQNTRSPSCCTPLIPLHHTSITCCSGSPLGTLPVPVPGSYDVTVTGTGDVCVCMSGAEGTSCSQQAICSDPLSTTRHNSTREIKPTLPELARDQSIWVQKVQGKEPADWLGELHAKLMSCNWKKRRFILSLSHTPHIPRLLKQKLSLTGTQ